MADGLGRAALAAGGTGGWRSPKRRSIGTWESSGRGAKVGRRSHLQKDPAAEAAFREGGFEEKLGALAIPAGRVLRVWVTDEARFGLHTVPRRMWSLRGVRGVVPHQQKDEWDYTYGAVEVTRAGSVFCFQSTVNQESYSNAHSR